MDYKDQQKTNATDRIPMAVVDASEKCLLDENALRLLLDKYFEAETTLDEEALLGRYFERTESIPSDLKAVAGLFTAYRHKSAEKMAQAISLKSENRPSLSIRRYLWLPALSAAATVALLFALVFHGQKKQDAVCAYIDGVPVYDCRLAIDETRKILQYAGEQWEKTAAPLEALEALSSIEAPFRQAMIYISTIHNNQK